jgi:hypothetical protein
MALAHVGVHAEHRTDEVAESKDMVVLRSIHANLACLVGITIHVLYETPILSELPGLQYRTGSAVCARASTESTTDTE